MNNQAKQAGQLNSERHGAVSSEDIYDSQGVKKEDYPGNNNCSDPETRIRMSALYSQKTKVNITINIFKRVKDLHIVLKERVNRI